MKIFLDTNVLLDIFMRREPYYDASAQVVYACERGQFTGGFTTLSACNIAYALRKQLGNKQTIEAIRQLVRIIEPIGTGVASLLQSLEDPQTDFEDDVCGSDIREERTAKSGRSDEHEFLHLFFTFSGPSPIEFFVSSRNAALMTTQSHDTTLLRKQRNCTISPKWVSMGSRKNFSIVRLGDCSIATCISPLIHWVK